MTAETRMVQKITLPNVNQYKPESYEILPIDVFKIMDNAAIEYGLGIPLMMEQAGYQLARLVFQMANKPKRVVIGVGPGNNGGGGLVAARRLQAWGIDVSLHIILSQGNPLFHEQLDRCIKFSVSTSPDWNAEVFVDAYLGFSQRLPLSDSFLAAVTHANQTNSIKISLDLPTGIGDPDQMIHPDAILTLAAPKTSLVSIMKVTPIYIADLGIPFKVYRMFGYTNPLPFGKDGFIQWIQ